MIANPTPVQTETAAYIARHGIVAFLDEDYNLTGTRVRAVVTERNVALALALGLPVAGRDLPVAVAKQEIWAVIEGPRRAANRRELAELFADETQLPGLEFGQRLFLEWHYRSPNNYQWTLEKSGAGAGGPNLVARVLGWNMETELTGPGDFVFYTGLLGCTGLCAVAADGAVFMSHWDGICNPRQFAGYQTFAVRHPGGAVRVVGVTAAELAAGLRQRVPGLAVSFHRKPIYFETNYTVRFCRRGGVVDVSYCEVDVTDDYVSSCHNNEYGRWFPYGRFSQAYPGGDQEFQACRFLPVA